MTAVDPQSKPPQPAPSELDDDRRGPSILLVALVALLVSSVVVTSALLAYDHTKRDALRYATVNVSQLIEAHELLFSDLVTSPSATDSDRTRAMQLAEQLGTKLTSALDQTRAECGCLLLVSSAVVGRADADLTATVGARIGLKAEDIAAASARLKATMLAQRVAPTRADAPRPPGSEQPTSRER